MELFLTLLTGLFFLLGIILNLFCHDRKKVGSFALSLAFIILLNLIISDILPEVIENIDTWGIVFILLGIGLLKIFDMIVPHHHHDHHDGDEQKKAHNLHEEHISVITVLALSFHNILECMALHSIALKDIGSGFYMALGIALHNIPLGFQIGSSMRKRKILYAIILTLSGFCGGIISLLIGDISLKIENYILCFTLGMLIYLTFFELFHELISHKKNKSTLYGIIIGIIIIAVGFII